MHTHRERASSVRRIAGAALLFVFAASSSARAQSSCVADASVTADALEASLRTARVHFSARRYSEAAGLARSIAIDHPSSPLAASAADLFARASVPIVNRRDAGCAAAIIEPVTTLRARYCSAGADAPGEPCQTIVQAHCYVQHALIQTLAREGRHDDAFREGIALARARPFCPRVDTILYNAALHAEAAGHPEQAVRTREILLSNFARSPLRPLAAWHVAAHHHRLEHPADAATAYERFAHEWPNERGASCSDEQRTDGLCPDARIALRIATQLRLSAGDTDAARVNVERFERAYGRTDPQHAGQLALAILNAELPALRPAERASRAERWLRAHPGTSPDLVSTAHMIAARAYRELRRPEAMAPHLASAQGGFSARAVAAIRAAYEGIAADVRVWHAYSLASEAAFLETDAGRDAILAQRTPIDPGALRALEADLVAIDPPPLATEWRLAALERLGEVREHAATLRSGSEAETLRRSAVEAYASCAALQGTPTDTSRRCAQSAERLGP